LTMASLKHSLRASSSSCPAAMMVAVILASCAGIPPSSGVSGDFDVVMVDGVAPPPSLRATVSLLDGGGISGFAGCNAFFGDFIRSAGALTPGALSMTRRACEPSIMDFETRLRDSLEASRTYAVDRCGVITLQGDPPHSLVLAPVLRLPDRPCGGRAKMSVP
jgi:heat shock protein HslJ